MIAHLIADALARHHDRVLLDTGEERWTFGRLFADASRRTRRAAPLEGCTLAMRNGYPLLVELVARILAGTPPLLANPAMPAPALAALAARLRHPAVVRDAAGDGEEDPLAPEPLPAKRREDEPAFHLLTSGTTGAPRMAARSHRSLAWQTPHIADAFGLAPGARVLAAAPLFHSYGIEAAAICSIYKGSTLIMPAGAPFGLALAGAASALCATHVFANPPLVKLLVDARSADARILPGLAVVVTAGARLPDALAEAFRARFGFHPRPVLGLTETGCVSVSDGSRPPLAGYVGELLEGFEARVVDLDGRPLPSGAEGAIEIRKPFADLGYPDDPAATAERFAGGWFRTGDLGRLDGRSLHLLGSRSGRINVGGEKVDPGLVEAALLKLPGVIECVAYGAPHAALGTVVAACVHATDPAVTAATLRAALAETLEPVAVPARIEVSPDPLPRTPAGKLSRALFDSRR